jgi:hypothetical protein
MNAETIADRLGQSRTVHLPFYAGDNLSFILDPVFLFHEAAFLLTMSSELPYRVRNRSHSRHPVKGIKQHGACLSGSRVSAATANIPNPRLREEKAPAEQPRLFPFCSLIRKTKRTCPCSDRPTSSLHVILGVAQTVVCSHWTVQSRMLNPVCLKLQFAPLARSHHPETGSFRIMHSALFVKPRSGGELMCGFDQLSRRGVFRMGFILAVASLPQ